MSLTLTAEFIKATQSPGMEKFRNNVSLLSASSMDRTYFVEVAEFDEETLKDLVSTAILQKESKVLKTLESVLLARTGNFSKPVPNFKAFKPVLTSYLRSELIDGWIYVKNSDGKFYPELVTGITYYDGISSRSSDQEKVVIHTARCTQLGENGTRTSATVRKEGYTFEPGSVARRRISDILQNFGIFKETPELRAEFDATMERYRHLVKPQFTNQFRVSGCVYRYESQHHIRKDTPVENRKVIHDLEESSFTKATNFIESTLFENDETDTNGVGEIPEVPIIRVFDLKKHEFFWVNSDYMTPYVYDKTLREKLILPASHRDLLDVLTSDLDAFVGDIIEGKSAGNVILCKGIAGVGKTLSAECYAEIIERPLYSIHAGNLGTTASQIDKSLQEIFQRSERWGCVLLLDEADVFVVQRGSNIEQNAIVAEFLRTLEYFSGLMFMTTNRPNDIDDAIISRCAAIINYEPPEASDAAKIWRVMANQYQSDISDALINDLTILFPKIAPRDIKMLFRLALRVNAKEKETLSIETFRRCAMFRAIQMETKNGSGANHD